MSFQQGVAVFLGAGLGGLARWLVLVTLPTASAMGISLPLLSVNVLGGFLAGSVYAFLSASEIKQSVLGLFLMTGFLGGFTTFSAFTAEGFTLWLERPWFSLLQAVMHVSTCLLAFGLAIRLFRGAPV